MFLTCRAFVSIQKVFLFSVDAFHPPKKGAGELFLKNSERNFGLFDLKLLNVKRKREEVNEWPMVQNRIHVRNYSLF